MQKYIFTASLMTSMLFSNYISGQNKSETNVDSITIKEMVIAFEKAFNDHNAKAFAGFFLPDGEFTNVTGIYIKGQKKIEEFHRPMFSGDTSSGHSSFKNAIIKMEEPRIRFIQKDIASVDILWGLDHAISPGGKDSGHRRGLITWTIIKQRGKWSILIMHNANLPPL